MFSNYIKWCYETPASPYVSLSSEVIFVIVMTHWECYYERVWVFVYTKMSSLLWGQVLNVANLNMRLVQLNKVFYYGNHNFFYL